MSDVRRALWRQIQCDGKERYGSFALANKIATRRNRRHDQDHLGAYRCRWCGSFHVGTRAEQVRRPRFIEAAE